ncbi:MAG TPA: SLBB domain-containing protein [Planctomycetaceae bacterium]|nr:SLBB domain-containing protein [Planctomycetaceae bacterium]
MLLEPILGRSLVAMAILMGIGHPGESARAADYEPGGRESSAHGPVIGIMGQVARPGAYELNHTQPTISDLVGLAGGTTDNASGTIRVIRRQQSGHQTLFLNGGLAYALRSDDLVIVEARQLIIDWRIGEPRLGGVRRQKSANGTDRCASVVQLGLLNLSSHPVVLNATLEKGTLDEVLGLLGRPVAGNTEVAVLTPGGSTQIVAVSQAPHVGLVSGSVLVFDAASVSAASLPRLPESICAAVPLSIRQLPAPPARLSPPGESPIRPTPANGPDADRHQTPAGHAPTSAPRRAPSDRAKPAARSFVWICGMAVLVGGLSLCGILVILSRMSQRSQIGVARPAVEKDQGVLDKLIANSLPIVEEQVALTSRTQIFGCPTLESQFRVDAPHALAGPHYRVEPARTGAMSAAPRAPRHAPKISETHARKIRIDGAHPPSARGALDRALAAFEKGQA